MNYASEERAGEPWRGHRRQAHDLWRCESENVAHVQIHPSRQGPIKAVQQLRHPELQRVQTQLHPGARPPPGPERQVPEVATPPDDEVCIGEEPRRPEHFGVRPVFLVAAHGPDVYPDAGRSAPRWCSPGETLGEAEGWTGGVGAPPC
jgi:hypothetical protein